MLNSQNTASLGKRKPNRFSFAGGFAQMLFDEQGSPRDVDVAATCIPAGDAFAELDLDRLFAVAHLGSPGAAGEGRVCCHVSVSHLYLVLITSGVMAGVFPDQQRHYPSKSV